VKTTKKKELSLDQAANQLAAIIEKHLEKLPPAERKRRIKKAHNRVLRAVARNKIRKLSVDPSRSSTPGGMAPNPLAARGR